MLIGKVNILSYNQSCTQNAGCDSTEGLSCSFYNQTLYVCLCANLYYWTGTTCTPQIMGNTVTLCTSTAQCRNDLGLYCSTNCVCNSTFYWDTVSNMCCNLTIIFYIFRLKIPITIFLNKKYENYITEKHVIQLRVVEFVIYHKD